MTYRAAQAFTSWVGGTKRQFKQNQIVPDSIAAKVLALTFDDSFDGDDSADDDSPRKRPAEKATHVSD